MKLHQLARRAARPTAAVVLLGALGACDSLLDVENPGQIGTDALNDTLLVAELGATPQSNFNRMYDDLAYATAILSDEAVTGHNFTEWQEIDLRLIRESNGILDDIYQPVQRTRASGDDMAQRIRALLGDRAESSPHLARALVYGGYGTLLLGEAFCEAPVSPTEAALTSDQILQRAAGIFEDAMTVAQAANNTHLLNLARVGAARTYLNLNDKAKAVQYASAVPAGFAAWAQYDAVKGYTENTFLGATTGTNRNLGMDKRYRDFGDPRLPFGAPGVGHNGVTILYVPFQSLPFEGFTTAGKGFEKGTDMRFASGLEARYIVAEALGGANAATVDFVNERRAAGGKAPLAVGASADEVMAALRVERAVEFYLDGRRLGDLRRYKAHYNVDLFPQGAHPNASWGDYQTAECYIPDRSERIGNPGY